MVSTVTQRLTFEEYLAYDDGTDHHYELVDGQLILMTPPRVEHFLIVDFIDMALRAEMQERSLPWLTFRESGVRTGYAKFRRVIASKTYQMYLTKAQSFRFT